MDICFVREKGSGTRFYQEVGLSELKLNPYLIEINNIKIIKQMVEAEMGLQLFQNQHFIQKIMKINDNNFKCETSLLPCSTC